MNLNKEKIKENWPEINRRLKAKYRNLEDQDLTFKEDWDAELLNHQRFCFLRLCLLRSGKGSVKILLMNSVS
jgi:hypothetical protein